MSPDKRETARQIIRITKQLEKIDNVLAPYKAGDTPTNNIYRWYGDNGKIGKLLRMKDALLGKRHTLRVALGIYLF